MHRRALEGYEEALGPGNPDTLNCLNNLGSVLEIQGKYEEAEDMHRQALEGYEKALGPEHPNTLTIMNNLAHTWISQDKVQDALGLMEKCIELRNRLLGLDHPGAKSSSRTLNTRKKTYTPLPTKQLQAFVQAEYDQVRNFSTESQGVVTKFICQEHITLHRRQE
ncbi:hypothetical protein BBP40_009515 [Aspergillus hancockii]|nr:hypothetical protein BBP40_009515 [Aspergillus hancockii]